jgi:xylulose-5-phosphate/fructose-6-phosphate phosphoketolase
VSELSCLGIGDERHPCTIGMSLFNQLFTEDKPIIFNFHGYPSAIHKLVHGHPASMRMFVHGYIDEGSTTTPFDMQLVNKTSRYHLALDAIYKAKAYNPSLNLDVDRLCKHIQAQIELDKKYILAAGEDPEAIVNFCWQN